MKAIILKQFPGQAFGTAVTKLLGRCCGIVDKAATCVCWRPSYSISLLLPVNGYEKATRWGVNLQWKSIVSPSLNETDFQINKNKDQHMLKKERKEKKKTLLQGFYPTSEWLNLNPDSAPNSNFLIKPLEVEDDGSSSQDTAAHTENLD